MPPNLPPQDGFLLLDKSKFAAPFAANVKSETAAFMANSQVPWGVAALSGAVSEPAWKSKPSWYLVATDNKSGAHQTRRRLGVRRGQVMCANSLPDSPGQRLAFEPSRIQIWWSWGDLNPRPQAFVAQIYMFSDLI